MRPSRAAAAGACLAALALPGCAVVEHAQVVPLVDQSLHVSCCCAFVEIPPSTQITATFDRAGRLMVGASWIF
ncbi:hypothetical protein [Cupriavidus malaysiensis]|uniref:Uncharacterized protein n=1 Tax=Cupriavidus malaysiensis TaxID=367825 RepID=A0ABM6F597_9BURK|nr:hypothetical protein [Cupriavidus malaysiensis]AOZ06682.1 hypothetical protein BKK80_13320 [Cupriavidus malaysiensis]